MIPLIKNVGRSFLNLVYPPLCLHCRELLGTEDPLFCSSCLQLLTPIEPAERCPCCFSCEFNPEIERVCHRCRIQQTFLKSIGAVFDYEGPAGSLVRQMKYGGQFYLAKGAGAFLAMQFLRLDWPLPDLIVPMPISFLRRVERGYNQSLLLAQSLGKILNRPVDSVLKRRSGDFSQAGLSHEQRLQLSHQSFSCQKGLKLYDKTILLVDDVMTTGSSLRSCAEALVSACPNDIYALTLCRAI